MASINHLLGESFPALLPTHYDKHVLRNTLPFMTSVQPALLSSGTYYIAENAEGEAIGCGGWTRERPGNSEVIFGLGHIRHFCTHSLWVNRGVGRAIYLKCEEEARSGDVSRFECYSTLNAVRFYEALGFSRKHDIEIPMANNASLTAAVMFKTICAG